MRRRTALIGTGALAAVVAVTGTAVAVSRSGPAVHEQMLRVPVGAEPSGAAVSLDATLYTPDSRTPAPAVLLAHGFGGSKYELDSDARDLARRGYVVLTYTARGFGVSGGDIHLDAPGYEIADARRMVDLLADRPEVLKDGQGDPRVGVAGGSYGGALTLLLAATDPRVDAIAPQITWNDLRQALFPQFAVAGAAGPPASPAALTPADGPGVFKRMWAGVFFSPSGSPAVAGLSGSVGPTGSAATVSGTPVPAVDRSGGVTGSAARGSGETGPAIDRSGNSTASGATGSGLGATGPASCGRFAPDVCAAYQQVATTGRPTPQILDLLWQSSPARLIDRIHAPTLLAQGEADSLFPLSEGDANARGIAANGTPVKVVWEGGGHDGGLDETDRLRSLTLAWFDHYLKRDGTPVDTRFEVTVPSAALSAQDTRPAAVVRAAPGEPGVSSPGPVPTTTLPLTGRPQVISAPAGGSPAAVTSLPGVGAQLSALSRSGAGLGLSAMPGQVATFQTASLGTGLGVVGSSRVTLHVAASAPDATLFVQLYDVAADGSAVLPMALVSPVHLDGLTPAGRDVTVTLPAVVRDVAAGHRLRLAVSTTDQAYALPADPRTYRISLADDPALTVPLVATTTLAGGGLSDLLPWALGLLGLVLAVGAGAAVAGRRRQRADAPEPELAEFPLVIRGLGKAYGDGFRAVSDLSLTVRPGWVLGLLGPNGAGKTTTLRMAMGLIRPSEGEIRVFGHRVTPGAAVLSRVGSFVEGPGFLPHVSGLENLRLFWAATGRPAGQAHLEEALEVAGLGEDVHRRVKTYSQGMRQRLAIAQAMLGLPDLLLLDEPTNGLDPPQIREMRDVLARYAATGRTVVVSSHLLAEVEQTCSHVVVMHGGRLVAQGPVAELVGAATSLVVDVDDPVRAADVAGKLPGARQVEITGTGLVLQLVGTPRSQLVRALVEAGLQVDRVAPRHGLEEAFLALVGQEG
ncbi:MAG TPA: alpha/beta fold hydrolase [Kineosporiaceae bacterium]|nr:alpha/beta fold hydrolase [Kineosporiaceae bacterium]